MSGTVYSGHQAQLPPINRQATVTGRFNMASSPSIHQLPKEDDLNQLPDQQGYLFRNGTDLVAFIETWYVYPSDFVATSQPGDLLLILLPGRNKKPRLFSRRDSTKYLWRQLKGRDALVQQLQVLALLQRS